MLKPSKYNYTVKYGDSYIYMNGVTENTFMIPAHRREQYDAVISFPEENRDVYGSFISRMVNSGFIVDDAVDELEKIKAKYDAQRRPDQLYLMVLPTYQCNLRCWYCTQEHADVWMSDEIYERVKKYIVRNLKNDEIKELHLSWFGGEPLMAYSKVLDLTRFAKGQCEEMGKRFTCAITTNATLLNPKRIEELRDAGVTHYQITIDGPKEIHNKVKVLGDKSAFDRTLENISLIALDSQCSLRFNYTHENLRPEAIIHDVKERLAPEALKNIFFSMFKVWQEDGDKVSREDVEKLFSMAKDAEMRPELSRSEMCYADQIHYDCIFPNGRVGKCDNMPLDEEPGMLMEDGTVKWDKEIEDYHPRLFVSGQKECMECKYLPICFGPCAPKRADKLSKGEDIKCIFEDKDKEMAETIINIFKTVSQK